MDFPQKRSNGKLGGVSPHHNEKDRKAKALHSKPASTNSYSFILNLIFLMLFLPLVGCLCKTTIFYQLTRNFWLWSNNTVSHFSMIPTVKESNELCFWRFGKFTNSVNEQNFLWSNNTVFHFSMIPTVKESNELCFYRFGNFTNSVKKQNFLWSNNTVSHFSMIPIVKESNELSLWQFGNFTNSVKEQNLLLPMKEMEIGIVQLTKAAQVNLELENAKLIQEAEIIESVASHTDPEQASQGKPELEDGVVEESILIPHGAPVSEFEPKAEELISDAEAVSYHIDHEAQSIITEKEQKAQVPKAPEIKSEIPPAEKLHGENKLISNAEVESSIIVSEAEHSESEALTANSQSFKEVHLPLKEKSSVNVYWISFLILILTVTAAFLFAKQLPVGSSMSTANMENTHQERLSSSNWLTEVDMVGEPCPSEMSSFQRSTSYSKQESKGANETQSQERGLRKKSNKKESLASTSEYSMGSWSYGSYKSYEKIHFKQECGAQEVVTPFRRSSRVRNQVPKSKNDSEFVSDTDQSLPPYDPETNYLAPRPRFLYYNPNRRIERIHLAEWQNEDVEESEATLEETVQVDSNVSEPRTTDAKVVSKSYSFFRLKSISLLMLLLFVGCLWIKMTDSPYINSVNDSSIGKELRFTKLYEPAELTEVARTNYDGLSRLTRKFRLWSTNTVSYFSKMIPILKESNELSFLRFGSFKYSQVDLVGSVCLVRGNKKRLQWPMKELEIGTVQMKEQGNVVTEANETREEASYVNPEFEKEAKLIQGSEKTEPYLSKIEQIQGEFHVASHIDIEQASQGKSEFEEANLSLKGEFVEPHNSEVQHTEEESKLISHKTQSFLAEKEMEDQVSQLSDREPKVVELQCEEKPISDAEFEPKVEELQGEEKLISDAEVEPEAEELQGEENLISNAAVVPGVEELTGEEKSISDAEAKQVQDIEKLSSDAEVVASHIDYEKGQQAQFPQVSEINSELPQPEKLPSKDKLISNAEVESTGAVSVPQCSESEALTESSQSFMGLYLSLKEKSSAVKVLGISLLILVLTVVAAFISGKQQKSPSPTADAIPKDQLLARKLASMPTASVENSHQERLSSRNWLTEVDMVGQSCPSEMSSFQRTIFYHKRGSKGASSASEYSMGSSSYSKREAKGASEAQSQERGLRKSSKRESLASSSEYSMGSTSYGSYESYEKISRKNECGGQEVVIPVRRSCRIRNQVASS